MGEESSPRSRLAAAAAAAAHGVRGVPHRLAVLLRRRAGWEEEQWDVAGGGHGLHHQQVTGLNPPPPPGSPLFPPPPSLSRACCTRDLGFVGWVLARFGVLLGSWFSGVGEICDLAVDQVKSLRWKNACVSRSIFLRDPWCVVGDSSPTSSSRSWVGLGSLCIWGCLIPDFLASDPTRGFPPCS